MINKKVNPSEILNSIGRISKLGTPQFIFSIIGSIIIGIAGFAIAYSQGFVISEATRQIANGIINNKTFILIILAFLLILPINFLGLMTNISGGLFAENKLKKNIILNTLNHNERFIKSGHTGDLMSRLTSDTSIISDYYFQGLNYKFISPTIAGIVALFTICITDFRLGLVAIIFGTISTIVAIQFSGKIQSQYIKSRALIANSTKALSEILSNNEIIRLFAIEDTIVNDYNEKNYEYADAIIIAEKYNHTVNSLNRTFSIITQIAFLGLGAYLSKVSNFDFTKILILLPLQLTVATMFGNFGSAWNYLVEVSTSSNRLLELIDTPWENKRIEKGNLALNNTENPFIEFKDIEFSYNSDKKIINNLNLKINKNETIALVGSSGSGKSTLFQLLLNLYEPDSGDIKIDNISFKDCNLHSWREKIIYIQQESPLFNKTIRENIELGINNESKKASDEEIIKASKLANIHDFIMTLPNGYNTLLGEMAGNISGGQRQRIVIARAFMSDAPILIMDEPTSALDSESEQLIQESLNILTKDKTVLVAAHRLSTIKDADRIVVLDNGNIVESGTHEELFDLKGQYYNTVNS